MKANRKELALLRGKRGPEALQIWTQVFASGSKERAERYALAVATFLGEPPAGESGGWNDYLGHYSPNTRKVYAFALTEFFEWIAAQHDRVVPPDQVTRLDSENYVNWLANRPFSLASEKLKDGDVEELRELYEVVQKITSGSLQDIIDNLSAEQKRKYFGKHPESRQENRRALSMQVRKLVTMDVLEAQPTMTTLRESYSQAGLTQWEVPMGPRGESLPIEEVFIYSNKEYSGVSRSTISQRVSALSTFWKILMQGENVKNGEPLLQYDVWSIVKKRVNRGITSEQRQASKAQKMPSDAVIQMLRNAPARSLVQMRNRAMLYLMVFAAVRTTEILLLRRSRPERGNWKAWFDGGEPPALQLVRKGNKQVRLPYPTAALKPLIEFQQVLDNHAAPSFAQYSDPKGEHYVPRESSAWYYRDLQLPDAPLFPPLSLWGNMRNKRVDYRRAMSRIQCFRILKQLAKESGLPPEIVDKAHPHAIRHFAANAMLQGGKDIREVQAILGHTSITTTESYLEDPEGDIKLSGQEAVLSFLDARGAEVKPTYDGSVPAPRQPSVIDTVADLVGEDESDPEVSEEEVQVLSAFEPEQVPNNELPVAPPNYDPEVVVMAMPGDESPVVETEDGLVGVDGRGDTEELLQDLAQMVRGGQSPGSPSWVYESMANPTATHETIIFNRGGEKDLDWLHEHYPRMPKNFGVGHSSYLLWYVRAQGNISRGGFFKGLPPFPVFSSEQCNPETTLGEQFIARIESAYSKLVHGDPEQGVLPSPMRSIGMVRWYSFFVYHGTKYDEEMSANFVEARAEWKPWDSVVDVRDVRSHEDAWLVQWLVNNAHTYRASIDAMKRGVSRARTTEDLTSTFLRSSFEGVELITDVPEWMIYDDPVRQLYESDRSQWKEMIEWLKNVTGQQLDTSRRLDRDEQVQTATEEQKTKAKLIRDVLTSVVHLVDQVSRAKHTARERVGALRDQLRTQLYWYATAAGGVTRLSVTLDSLKGMSTREFKQAMSLQYKKLGVPDPNAPEYREKKGKKRVAAIVAELFPDLPELNSGNVFADSKLFDPAWFRIDEDKRTIYIERAERESLQRQFGQDPELLVRRATRAMWEARDKGYEALWGVMMSYFSWIVPSGREMQSQVLGIPVADLGAKDLNVQARKNWLKAWSSQMKRLAMGQDIEALGEEERKSEKATEEEMEPWRKFLLEEESKTGEDALDRIAGNGVDFAMATSISGGYADSPEDIAMAMEKEYGEDGDYLMNRRVRKLRKNGRESFVFLEGEQPKKWYKVDLFGRRQGHLRPNAPPMLISPGVVYRSQKRVFAARQLLPSPFRMISGMDLSDE